MKPQRKGLLKWILIVAKKSQGDKRQNQVMYSIYTNMTMSLTDITKFVFLLD